MSQQTEIDIEDLEEKRKRVKAKSDNPHSKEYGDKLAELLNSRAIARDNFINWITGLATGSMFLAFSGISAEANSLQGYLVFSGIASFFCIASAMAFKILLEVRFSALELEVSLLKSIWQGHDIRTQLEEMVKEGKEITEEDKQKFLRNINESLDYLDEAHLEELKKPINRKSRIWVYSYWQTLALFILGTGIMAYYYVQLYCSTY